MDFLDYTMDIPEEIIITGDLNFHLDNKSDCDGRKFIEMLNDRGLVQHVIGATHVSGHTLDVIISRDNSPILIGTPSIEDSHICDDKGVVSLDHLAVLWRLNILKPARQRKSLTIRKININIESFKADLNSGRFLHDQDTALENVVETYDSALRSVLDIHAPVLTKTITLRPNTEWYSDELRYSKIERRKAERMMRKTKLEVHILIYKELCIRSNKILLQCKIDYYSTQTKLLILETITRNCSSKPTVFWATIMRLLCRHTKVSLNCQIVSGISFLIKLKESGAVYSW